MSGSVRGLIVTSGLLPQPRGALWVLLDIAVSMSFNFYYMVDIYV